ncbi:5-formyltetrahydrofolate cyclo-ligase [Dysgonomonas sp. 25]|uniref:5-formyltetrahydrofolate cyclo-ligase n=1 Tax=Dysgonomonas sp. 25 TaxID=2302933 RepID=UPI0013D0C31E|nr:5-formyltetrahydrofolate cyclo-ligase [Dysgonomonas sp. 25]NDV68174.1 5-formyltetrahydrofolate cyclo-ligase [Dysgonomonas sp. 25]
MENIAAEKQQLRKKISKLKEGYTDACLLELSGNIISRLEVFEPFVSASRIFIYNNMPKEVATSGFIKKWIDKKEFYLPVTDKNTMFLRKYTSDSVMTKSAYGIWEPEGENISDISGIDLIIVPGVAFDKKMNRLGYGKGYYDRFLPETTAPKVGLCFGFQLFDSIPNSAWDVKMNYIITEKGIIG